MKVKRKSPEVIRDLVFLILKSDYFFLAAFLAAFFFGAAFLAAFFAAFFLVAMFFRIKWLVKTINGSKNRN
jgi:hypothetical protein